MRITTLLPCGCFLLLGFVLGAETAGRKPSIYSDGLYGFTLNAPAFDPAPKGSSVIPVMLLGPSEAGFATNVNVLVESTRATRDAYLEKTLGDLKAIGAKVIAEKSLSVSGKDAIRLEYEGDQQGRKLRWLVLIVLGDERVYAVTCTALAESFKKHEAAFRACLDSFKLEGK